MKKWLKIIALSLALIMSVMALAACGNDKDDDEKKETAVPNSDPAKAEEALEDADYEVYTMDSADELAFLEGTFGEGIEAYISATKVGEDEELEDAIVIIYYEDEDAAADAYDTVEEFMEMELDDVDLTITMDTDGNMIWYGTKQAIKDAK